MLWAWALFEVVTYRTRKFILLQITHPTITTTTHVLVNPRGHHQRILKDPQ